MPAKCRAFECESEINRLSEALTQVKAVYGIIFSVQRYVPLTIEKVVMIPTEDLIVNGSVVPLIYIKSVAVVLPADLKKELRNYYQDQKYEKNKLFFCQTKEEGIRLARAYIKAFHRIRNELNFTKEYTVGSLRKTYYQRQIEKNGIDEVAKAWGKSRLQLKKYLGEGELK